MNQLSEEHTILTRVYQQAEKILNNNIIPFWLDQTLDSKRGGFFGMIDNTNAPDPSAAKSVILNTRILWSFSRIYGTTGDKNHRAIAERAFDYITKHFVDTVYGGLFWEISPNGKVLSDRKQTYAQAFAMYAFSEYYNACGNRESLELACSLFNCVEIQCRDSNFGGYIEAATRNWGELDDLRLSPKDMNEKKSNNTHLHLLEAYTTLYRNNTDVEVRDSLMTLVSIMMDTIFNSETTSFTLFFNERWEPRSTIRSFGHDIEGFWLIYDALDALQDSSLTNKYMPQLLTIPRRAFDAYLDGPHGERGMYYESKGTEIIDTNKIWWVQAEASIGFLYAYYLTNERHYLDTVSHIWAFIQNHQLDTNRGEWYNYAVQDPATTGQCDKKVSAWKGPYHNSRACIQLMHLIKKIIDED